MEHQLQVSEKEPATTLVVPREEETAAAAAAPLYQQTEPIAGWRLAVIFFCLSICLLLSLMDETIVATALVVISE